MSGQIALVEIPVRDVSDQKTRRLMVGFDHLTVAGEPCSVRMTPEGTVLEFRMPGRCFEVSISDLAATVALAIEAHLGALAQRGAADTTARDAPRPDGM